MAARAGKKELDLNRFRPINDEILEIDDCAVLAESEKGLLVVFDDGEQEWIPKSHVHDDSEICQQGDFGKLAITKWIAERKSLLSRGQLRYVGI